MSATPTDNLIGSVLGGRYEISGRINRGGTAVVYRGIDRRLGRTVAVKVIHSDLSGDPDYVKRFDREARAAALLSHPNIVAVFDQGYAGDRPYIVMEYIRGQSLRSIIASSAPLPASIALAYADEIAKALAAAHEAGIIHRDIKPENVLITNEGQVKVTDFGLAKTITAQSSSASHGVLMGTMSYIAPEIPQTGTAGITSDIYSTGIVLYEMLTGKKPHTGEDLSQVLYKHIHDDIPAPSQVLSGTTRARIPDYVDALVVACTARDQARRPANGRVLEDWIAQARRSLEAGHQHDAGLVRLFSQPTPAPARTLPSHRATSPVTPIRPVKAENTPVRPPIAPPATPLAKAFHPSKRATDTRTATSKTRRGDPQRRVVVIILTILLAALLVAGATFVYWLAVGRWTTVPVLTGGDQVSAQTQLADRSLTMATVQEYSETFPTGQIIRTNPQAGQRVLKGGEVTVYLSKGQERYPMPTVAGLTREQAETAITSAHLKLGQVHEQYDETVASGTVISASIEPDQKLPPDTIVDLVVSKGREPIPVTSYVCVAPYTTCATADDAKQTLESAGFTVVIDDGSDGVDQDNYSLDIPAGAIISQTPADGTGYRGDSVTLVVSKGPPLAEVPNVWGKSLADAKAALAEAGFRYVESNANSTGLTLGFATSTSPKAGEIVTQGSTVTLYYV